MLYTRETTLAKTTGEKWIANVRMSQQVTL